MGYFIYNFSHSNLYISQCYFILHFPDDLQSIILNILSIFTRLLIFLWCGCVYVTRTLNAVQFIFVHSSHSVVSDSLRPHELQHTRSPCSSLTPGVYSYSCPLSHPTVSSSAIPFSSCLQSLPASGSFQMSHFFSSGGQSIGASALTSDLPMNIQD